LANFRSLIKSSLRRTACTERSEVFFFSNSIEQIETSQLKPGKIKGERISNN